MSKMLKKKMVIPDAFVCEKCGKTFRAMNPRSRCKDCIIKYNLAKYGKKEAEEK